MRIFVAGASGTLGRPVVRQLVERSHEVVGLTRSDRGRQVIERLGARAVVADALDAEALNSAVVQAQPDQVLHLLTALPAAGGMWPRQLRPTNRLRIEGTANLIKASRAAGASRIVAESFASVYGFTPLPESPVPHTEDEALPPLRHGRTADIVLALRAMEDQLRSAQLEGGIRTVALRIGFLYGSDVPSTTALIEQARAGRLFAPRDAAGGAPFVHLADAAAAIIAAVEHPAPSLVYNVAGDEALPLRTFLEMLAGAIAAPKPRRVPGWLIRTLAPMAAEFNAAGLELSNSRAKRELGWRLRYPTVREGLMELHESSKVAA